MSTIQDTILSMAQEAKKAAQKLSSLSTEKKNRVLLRMADALMEEQVYIRHC